MAQLPNILYMHSHDTGRFIQPYGQPVPTPNLQKLAEEGVLFRQAFCANPTCSPSRAALLTGQYPHNNGMLGLAHRGFSLNDYSQHLLHTLRKAGYYSALFGIQHITEKPEIIGYDSVYYPIKNWKEADPEPEAIKFLDNPPHQPFFMSVGLFETHRPFPKPGETENPNWCVPSPGIPDTPESRLDMAQFKASARKMDARMGAVLDALERNNLKENTLIICTTDHGICFPYCKCTLNDLGTGVMLIMRGPGGFTGGRVIDSMVSHMDIFPTLCELLKIEPPALLQGKSIMPLINGEVEEIHEEIFTELNFHAAYEPQRAIRTKRYKYIRRFEPRQNPVLPNCGDSYSKDILLEAGWKNHAPEDEQLYDLIFDPFEKRNLAAEPEMKQVLESLKNRLEVWMRETNDPLLKGRLELPEGATVNNPDDVSPKNPVRDFM